MSEVGSKNADDGLNDQLVAYLDGELDAEGSLLVEQRLAEDESFRRELQQLQKAWDLLDELPKSEVSEAFTQTTVEMVVLRVEDELETQEKSSQRKKHWWWLAGVGGFAGTALAAYWLSAMLLARPEEQLLRDLPVIEDVELYRVADSVEYIRQLEESGLFDEEVEDDM